MPFWSNISLRYRDLLARASAHEFERRVRIAERRDGASRDAHKPGEPISLETLRHRMTLAGSVPPAWYAGVLTLLASRPLRSKLNAGKHALQRARRGWDDTALWSLDSHICSTLAVQLRELAQITNGWPSERYDSFHEWVSELNRHADALGRYATRSNTTLHEEWYALLQADAPEPEQDAAMSAALLHEQRITEEAQSALRWVADVLPALWD